MSAVMDIRVAPLDLDESEAVSNLMTEVISALGYYSSEAKRSEISKYTSQALKESALQDRGSVLVARQANRIVGFCVSRYDDGIIWLSWFGVAADWRGKGIGNALLDTLVANARSKGIHKIWCDCRTVNEESQNVLRKAGFRIICEVTNHWYGHDFVLLEKTFA